MHYLKKVNKVILILMSLIFISSFTTETYADEIPENIQTEYLGQFKLTAYCGCRSCSGKWGTQTSSGATCQVNHTVAVDNKVIPEGTKLIINGIMYTAEDTGSGVKGNHIDIYFETHQETDNFGLQTGIDVLKVIN